MLMNPVASPKHGGSIELPTSNWYIKCFNVPGKAHSVDWFRVNSDPSYNTYDLITLSIHS